MDELTNIHILFLTWKGLIGAALFFFPTVSTILLISCEAKYSTCVPPLIVQILLTKLT